MSKKHNNPMFEQPKDANDPEFYREPAHGSREAADASQTDSDAATSDEAGEQDDQAAVNPEDQALAVPLSDRAAEPDDRPEWLKGVIDDDAEDSDGDDDEGIDSRSLDEPLERTIRAAEADKLAAEQRGGESASEASFYDDESELLPPESWDVIETPNRFAVLDEMNPDPVVTEEVPRAIQRQKAAQARLLAAELPHLSEQQINALSNQVAANAPSMSTVARSTAVPADAEPIDAPSRDTTSMRYIPRAGLVTIPSDMEGGETLENVEGANRNSKLTDAQARQLVEDNVMPRPQWHNPAEFERLVHYVQEQSAAGVAPERIAKNLKVLWNALKTEDGH